MSLLSGMDKNSLEVAPTAAASPQLVLNTEVGGQSSFNPPQRHQIGNESNSATALVRTKQPSSNKHIAQLFQTLLSVFGAESTLGSQLSSSSFGDMHLHRVIDSYAASTLMKYLSAAGNFIPTCKELGVSFLEISAFQLADILITVQWSKSSDTAGCSSTGTLKALRCWQKVAGVESWKPILFAPVIQSFLTIRIPSDRSESVPVPLWCVVQWEKRVLTSACPGPMVLILGFFLFLIWGSLRFSDAQRVDLRSLIYDGENLSGLSWRTKTTHRGQVFGVLAQGLMSKRSYHWLHKYLLTLGFSLDTSGNGIYGLSHAGCLRAARCFDSIATDAIRFGSQMASTLHQGAVETATLHYDRSCSLYYSFLQGNSPQLVGSASPPTDGGRTTSTGPSSHFCQRFLEIVQQGWRVPSSTPSRLPTGSNTSGMAAIRSSTSWWPVGSCRTQGRHHWTIFQNWQYGFPLVWFWDPTTIGRSFNSPSSWRSSRFRVFIIFLLQWVGCSKEGGCYIEEEAHTETTSHIFANLLWCHTFWRRSRSHAMIPDDSAQDSSLYWQDLPGKSACGRRLSETTQMTDTSQSNQIQAFCNHPGCRRAWESMYKAWYDTKEWKKQSCVIFLVIPTCQLALWFNMV